MWDLGLLLFSPVIIVIGLLNLNGPMGWLFLGTGVWTIYTVVTGV